MNNNVSQFRWILIFSLLVIATVISSCGSDDDDVVTIPRISDAGTVLAIEDLTAFGFKKSKTYDVEGLVGAESAYYGFWGNDPYDRKDYEVRFFASHADAVELGVPQADERSGDTAILDDEFSSWPVGMKDMRQCGGDKASGPASHGIQNCKQPKYWDYSIYSNMILLCAGGDVERARELCNDLLINLQPKNESA
ncbi:MAG: hypothetical protein QF676_04990 [Dehalococcoidia bacterium]|jgi:hypothetical protein|nr:hypothetical protein [Chloroflexota bacterium]MDP6056413.1 hypothetical protein [Dehalococcoidia bacterium]MDP7261935.1 hypothetical protein [Dehalococcoidia bacterium]MDP7485240.1 hypothetical protein [Dehalococcoidia bacterium]|tara:strand:+ start:657 stop:1241 length:585 start_codon:yes stop_codon:yes gene_type:complete